MRDFRTVLAFSLLAALLGCEKPEPEALEDDAGESKTTVHLRPWGSVDAAAGAGGADAVALRAIDAGPPKTCPAGAVLVERFCVDRYEAPNREGAKPLVMYSYLEAQDWCTNHNKRLCFDDEWIRACRGPLGTHYPYGNRHQRGRCNDAKPYRAYSQRSLSAWPDEISLPSVDSLDSLMQAAQEKSLGGVRSSKHVMKLYQGEPGGSHQGCASHEGVYDLCGNVEEWATRRDGGRGKHYSGKLMGRYWSEPRGCGGGVVTHGNSFRFYEIGFRCCSDPR